MYIKIEGMLLAEHGYESQHLPHILLENVGKQQKYEIYIC